MLLWGWAGAFGAKWRLTHDSLQVVSNWASSSAKLSMFQLWSKSQRQVARFVGKHAPVQDLASQDCSARGVDGLCLSRLSILCCSRPDGQGHFPGVCPLPDLHHRHAKDLLSSPALLGVGGPGLSA